MSHVRQQIRDSFFLALTGLTTTGANAYKSRVFPLAEENLPGLIVYTSNEDQDEEEGKQARYQFRQLRVVVEGYDKLTAGLDDQLDDIAAEIETALFAATLTGVRTLDLESSDTEIQEGAEQPVGKIILSFLVQYLTREGAPETAI